MEAPGNQPRPTTDAARLVLPGRSRPYLLAHRGNRAACPENTLAAFRRAVQDGADILETDLHLSADGIFMCIHDATVDRTTDGHGPVAEMTLDQLKKLHASDGRSAYPEERIPTLAELAAILPGDRAVALELKTDRFLEEETCARLAAELDTLGLSRRAVVLSFSWDQLACMRRTAPYIPTGWITLSGLRPVAGVDLLGPIWPFLFANPTYVAAAHRGGQMVCPLDPSPDRRLWYYRLLGCDAVLTDDPASTARRLRKSP
ncbi:MAG: hypothetical protein GYA17_04040 [Chloroflexi bacterium]|nr:glycerophosphodiester phosphodiesterase family protein [Anaerolineaceae bacterium]NMB87506.1 hypothetical protein [Chloroflexota bacterium]